MISPAKKAKIDHPEERDASASYTESAAIEPQSEDIATDTTPPAAKRNQDQVPGTSGTVGTTGSAYLTPTGPIKSPRAESNEVDKTSVTATSGILALLTTRYHPTLNEITKVQSLLRKKAAGGCKESFDQIMGEYHQKSISEEIYAPIQDSYLHYSSMADVTGFDDMPYLKEIVDKFPDPEFDGAILAVGGPKGGTTSLCNRIACPSGKTFFPTRIGHSTPTFIATNFIGCKDPNAETEVTVHRSDHPESDSLSFEEGKDTLELLVNNPPAVADPETGDFNTISVTYKSPSVPTLRIIQCPAIILNDQASIDAFKKFASTLNYPISVLYCMSSTDAMVADLILQHLHEAFREANLRLSSENGIVVMSKTDQTLLLIDNDVEGNATERAHHLEKRLRLEDGMVYNTLTRFPLVCVRNFNTGKLVPESQRGKDCFTREKDFIDENRLADLNINVGQFDLIQEINERFIPVHFHKWKQGELAKLEMDRQEKAMKLANLGENPAQPGFRDYATRAYNEKVFEAVSVLAKADKGSCCLTIVQEVDEAVGIDSSEFPDRLSIAIRDTLVNTVASAVVGVQGDNNKKLDRFANMVKGPYEKEVEHEVGKNLESSDFKEKCSEEITFYGKMARKLRGFTEVDLVSVIKQNTESDLAELAVDSIIEPVLKALKADVAGVLSGVDFAKEDSLVRKKLEESLEIIDGKIALLNRLPDPTASSTVGKNPAAGISANRNDERDSDEDGDAPNDTGRKDDGNNTDGAKRPSSDGSDGSSRSGGNNDGGAGGKPPCDKKEDTLCSLASLGSDIASPRAVSEQSPSDEGSNSDSENSVDFEDDEERTACKQHKSGQGRGAITPKKVTGTPSGKKRKQNSAGGSSKLATKRSRKDKNILETFGVGTKIKSDFGGAGWYEGYIIKKQGKKYVVKYSDGDEEKYTYEQLTGQPCHQIIGGTTGTLV